MRSEVFLDTSYAIALCSKNDRLHERAVKIGEQIEASGARMITTRAVLLEIGNALSKRHHRHAAILLLRSLEQDDRVHIVALSEELFGRGTELFAERLDKGWSLTDCISFVVMREHGLGEVLTFDVHFEQAGFRALLRDE